MFQIPQRIFLTLWLGSMWSIGYIVVPTLFSILDDRALAGQLAGRLFTIGSYLGLFCGLAILLAQLYHRAANWWRSWRIGVLLAMLLLIVIGEFVLQPMMAQLKLLGLGTDSAAAAQFARLHGVASLLFMANSLLGLVILIFGLHTSESGVDRG